MPNDSVTGLLTRWRAGDRQALDELTPLVYVELRRIARRHLRREPAGNSLQTTALVHEAYLKLVDQSRIEWQNRAQFYAVAGELIRRILVDHARARHRDKRGGAVRTLALDEALHISNKRSVELIALDDALNGLAKLDVQQSAWLSFDFSPG